jgi:hypothetical protein
MTLTKEQKLANQLYREAREKLIPLAEEKAYLVCGQKPKVVQGTKTLYNWGIKWNKVYLDEMDRLAHEQGLL